MNNFQAQCVSCHHLMKSNNIMTYCCDQNQLYCILCQDKICKKCGKMSKIDFQIKKCSACNEKKIDMICEPVCEKCYCGECLVNKIIKRNQNENMVVFPCGHQMFKNKVNQFLKGKYCFCCKKANDQMTSYDLINGQRCCGYCFRFSKKTIEPYLLGCVSCGSVLKNMQDVGTMNEGFIVCKKCKTDSEIQQNVIAKQNEKRSKQKRTDKSQNDKDLKPSGNSLNNFNVQFTHNNINQKANEKKQQPSSYDSQNYNSPKIQINIISPKKSIPEQDLKIDSKNTSPLKNMKSPPKSPKSVTTKNSMGSTSSTNLFKTYQKQSEIQQVESIIQFEQQPIEKISKPTQKKIDPVSASSPSPSTTKQQPSILSKSSNDSLRKTILHSFPSEKQQDQLNKPKLCMKKHMSMQTFVERMKIVIQKQTSQLIKCNDCQYQIPKNQSFSIENAQRQLKNYCRLCYTLLTNNQSLSFNLQAPKLDLSRNARGTSNQKYREPATNLYANPSFVNTLSSSQAPNHMKLSATNFTTTQPQRIPATSVNRMQYKSYLTEGCGKCNNKASSYMYSNGMKMCTGCYNESRKRVY